MFKFTETDLYINLKYGQTCKLKLSRTDMCVNLKYGQTCKLKITRTDMYVKDNQDRHVH